MTAMSFGPRLKELRQARGLNQSEVGFGRYSASYVSLLERGLRKPNSEVVRFLSDHLGVEPEQFMERERDRVPDVDHQLTVLDLAARNAWMERDYDQAIVLARRAAAAATAAGRPASWWSSTHLQASALLVLERYDECHDLAVELSNHEVAAESLELGVQALTLATRAGRAAGRLTVALEHVTQARARAEVMPASAPQRLDCCLAHVAVLADLGRLPEALEAVELIDALRHEVESSHLRGMAAWVLGNLAFLAGNFDLGLSEHDLARTLLKPEGDLRLWGRFHKGSATMRVARGDVDVSDLIEAADHALRLAGNGSDLRELDLVRAELALNQGDPTRTLTLVETAIDDSLPPNQRGEAETLRHRALHALGREEEAAAALAQAALLFEEAGAFRRALDAWRAHAGVPRLN